MKHLPLSLLIVSVALSGPLARAERVRVSLHDATIPQIQQAFAQGTLTSEQLVQMYLKRIAAYDDKGPSLNALILVNANALAVARELDKERKEKGPRGPLHGIPIIPKDNYDTKDLVTTGGFLGLAGSVPVRDAFTIRRLREGGAIILAKANLDEFNSGSYGTSGVGGQTKNPYNLAKLPGGSSAGTGAGVAAAFAQAGLGTETGSSIRNPSTKNNLVGIAPTLGLVSRHGVVPSSILLDRTGPMARNVTDAAIMLHGMGGMDAGDLITVQSLGHFPESGYESYLKKDALKHARIGVLRANFGSDPEDQEALAVIAKAIKALDDAGAVLVDPVPVGLDLFTILKDVGGAGGERKEAMNNYLAGRGDSVPVKTLTDIVNSKKALPRLQEGLEKADKTGPLYFNDDYIAFTRNRAALQAIVLAWCEQFDLDAIVYPYQTKPEYTIEESVIEGGAKPSPKPNYDVLGRGTRMSTATGFPGITVPAGFTASDGMPVGLEFLGKPWSEGPLLGYCYAFEQATKHRTLPASTPALDGEWIEFDSTK